MPTSASDALVINDQTYAGTFAPYFILPATFSMDTVNKGVVFVKDGIRKKHTIGRIDFTNPWQPRVADPVSNYSDVTIDGRVLEPQDQMLFVPFNPRDLETHWESEKLSPQLLARELTPTVESYMTSLIIRRAFEQVETEIWMGSTNYQNNSAVPASDPRFQLQFFDGLLNKMVNDSGIYLMASPVTLTSSNIGAKLLQLYQSVAANYKALVTSATKYERMKFIMSINTQIIYEEYLTTQPYKNNDTTQAGINRYKGYEIIPVAGFPDDTILFTEAIASTDGNLYFGMNSVSDEQIQLARLVPSSERFFVKMLTKLDTQYGFSNKIFLYTTLTTNSFIAT